MTRAIRKIGLYLADTVVVKETQSLQNIKGVVPVMSSHCAGLVPPTEVTVCYEIYYHTEANKLKQIAIRNSI